VWRRSHYLGASQLALRNVGGSFRRRWRFVNLFLDGSEIRWMEGLTTAVFDGAELVVLPALSEG